MDWLSWILVLVIVLLPLALFCYSAVATGIEIGRKLQPFVDPFFDTVAVISGYFRPRTPRIENRTKQLKHRKPLVPVEAVIPFQRQRPVAALISEMAFFCQLSTG